MVNAFVSLKTAGDDDQFKKELQYIMNYRVAAWLLHNACWMSFPIITRFRDVTGGVFRYLHPIPTRGGQILPNITELAPKNFPTVTSQRLYDFLNWFIVN